MKTPVSFLRKVMGMYSLISGMVTGSFTGSSEDSSTDGSSDDSSCEMVSSFEDSSAADEKSLTVLDSSGAFDSSPVLPQATSDDSRSRERI